jgi:hypothetical protein
MEEKRMRETEFPYTIACFSPSSKTLRKYVLSYQTRTGKQDPWNTAFFSEKYGEVS